MKKILQILVAIALLFAVNAGAQTDPLAKSRLDKQGALITQLAKRLVAAESAIKTGTGITSDVDSLKKWVAALEARPVASGVTLAVVDQRIKDRAVELPHIRPQGLWARREAEEAKFRSDLRAELDDISDDLGLVERAVAHPKRGERKAAIRAIRANEGW